MTNRSGPGRRPILHQLSATDCTSSWPPATEGPAILGRMHGYLFSSESVTEGHPDKLADQISDAVLDAMIAVDPNSRVACETLVTTGLVMVAGEISTEGWVDIPS